MYLVIIVIFKKSLNKHSLKYFKKIIWNIIPLNIDAYMTKYAHIRNNLKFVLSFSKRFCATVF